MKIQAIIPTAGSGTRLKADCPKPFISINGKPLIVYTLEKFQECSLIDSIVVVAHKDGIVRIKELTAANHLTKVEDVIEGGEHRWQSVSNGLKKLKSDTGMVVIHDGARPLVTIELIERAVTLGEKHDAVTLAVPVKPTIKRVDPQSLTVEETLDRSSLWEIQTPQVFKKEVIVKAHNQNNLERPTDDASMVEQLGIKVKILMGDYKNIKITTQEDLAMAEAFLSKEPSKVNK